MRKKRIAILIDLELSEKSGGHVKFWQRIAGSLKTRKLDYDITLFFLGNKSKVIRFSKSIHFNIIRPIISSKILRKIGVDADSTDLSPINLKLLWSLKNFDLIHTTDQLFSMSKTARMANKIWNIPLTTSYHTDAPSYTEYYVLEILKKLPYIFQRLLIHKLKLHKFVSNNQKKSILKYINKCKVAFINDSFSKKQLSFLGGSVVKIDKISRGIDKNVFFKKRISKKKIFKKLKINEDNKIIFFCGRIHKLKGAILLARIQSMLDKKKIKVTTVMAGENIHGNICKKICKNNLKILEYLPQEDISDLYNICDLFVFPSLYETGPQVVMEARSCGAICVVSESGGGKRIQNNGEDGIIITSQEPLAWVKEIEKLLVDKKKIQLMQTKVMKVGQYPSWEEIFNEIFLKKWKLII